MEDKIYIMFIIIGLIIVIGGTIYLGWTVKSLNQDECFGYQYPIYSNKGNIIGMHLKVCYIEDGIVKSQETTLWGNSLKEQIKVQEG